MTFSLKVSILSYAFPCHTKIAEKLRIIIFCLSKSHIKYFLLSENMTTTEETKMTVSRDLLSLFCLKTLSGSVRSRLSRGYANFFVLAKIFGSNIQNSLVHVFSAEKEGRERVLPHYWRASWDNKNKKQNKSPPTALWEYGDCRVIKPRGAKHWRLLLNLYLLLTFFWASALQMRILRWLKEEGWKYFCRFVCLCLTVSVPFVSNKLFL